ncbi:hypothetical protein H3S74_12300 [Gilliamella sp. W8126]|uniref:hypothetical protein n=1 Tax=Gilliamella sp. W8126 TaxID=2750946 RepID=UPI0018DB2AE4|nr:hypothetical protein [Gilliamella sp. W8126]MBI0007011.1 hypothetical protein [Gilliamella sp. W8126]
MKRKFILEAVFPVIIIIFLLFSEFNLNIFDLPPFKEFDDKLINQYITSSCVITLFYCSILVLIRYLVHFIIAVFLYINEVDKFNRKVLNILGKEFDFICLLMDIEYDGEQGVIIDISDNGNLIIKLSNKTKFKRNLYCDPRHKMKYFDEKGNVIMSYD